MKSRISLFLSAVVVMAALVAVGCSKAPNDAQLTTDIQSKFGSDSGLQGKQIGVQTANGTVTLSGTVDNDGQREAAARYASSEAGVKQVVNNLQVAPAQTAEAEPTPEPEAPRQTMRHKPTPSKPRNRTMPITSDDTSVASAQPPVSPAPINLTPPPSAPAPPPPPKKVTIPTGTTF